MSRNASSIEGIRVATLASLIFRSGMPVAFAEAGLYAKENHCVVSLTIPAAVRRASSVCTDSALDVGIHVLDGAMNEIARTEVDELRETLGRLGAVIAEIDGDLRYVWIMNAHPDFDSLQIVGRRDDELLGSDAAEIMALKREVLATGITASSVLKFKRSDGPHYYSMCIYPIREQDGRKERLLTIGFDSSVEAFNKVFKADGLL